MNNIGNIQGPRPEELGSVRSQLQSAVAANVPNPKDFVRVDAPLVSQETAEAEAPPQAPAKSLEDLRKDFNGQIGSLKGQTDDDKVILQELYKKVGTRSDLNSKEKEWLFATEVQAYTADQAMKMTGLDKKGQPWAPVQESRFRALAGTFGAAKDLVAAVTPLVEKPDSNAPGAEALAAAEALKNSPIAGATGLAVAPPSLAGVPLAAGAASPTAASSAAPAAAGDAPPPAPEPSTDPMVRIWEARRQEAQDMANDFKTLLQKTSEWKQRLLASRLAFFWKVYGMRAAYIAESWRR